MVIPGHRFSLELEEAFYLNLTDLLLMRLFYPNDPYVSALPTIPIC
jgi:hypothetical protein